ncbi:MAG: hypothetical protein JNM68_12845 [Dinghuibacter sp.]|nr:hypothetical protein [Dinghuibacter sp.]
MNRNLHILNELREISPELAHLPHQAPFEVPQGYFEHLAADILLAINRENGAAATGFSVPEGYFDGLAASIMGRVKAENATGAQEEIQALSPVLAGINRTMPFTVPRSYFDQLPEQVLNEEKGAKLVSMQSTGGGRVIARWVKYAAAACVVGLLAFGATRFLNKKTTENGNGSLANTHPIEQIKNFDLDAELEKLSDTDLSNYLCATGDIACNDDKKDDELNKQLSEISDEDLSKYLEGTN